MRMRIDLCRCQGMAAISQGKRELMQPLKIDDPAIVLPESHREHTGHEHFDTMQTTGTVFWCRLIDYNDLCPMLLIGTNEALKIVSQIHTFWRILIKILKCFLESLLARGVIQEMQPLKRLWQRVHQWVMVHSLDKARIREHLHGPRSALLIQLARMRQKHRVFAH